MAQFLTAINTARRQRPRSRFGLVCRTTQAAELDQREPNFRVVFSEKSLFFDKVGDSAIKSQIPAQSKKGGAVNRRCSEPDGGRGSGFPASPASSPRS